MLTLTSCRYLLEKPLVELGFLAGLYFPGAPQAHSELLHLGRAKRIQFNSVRPCWLEFPAVNFSRGFLRIPMRGGGGLLPLLQSHMPLFNDLLGCELSGTDFAARTFGARRLPAAPKLCSTHSRNPTACERRASWRSSPYFPKTSPRTKRMRMTPQAASPMDCGVFPLFALALSAAPWPLQLAALV